MRVNDILNEQQLDEINWSKVGNFVGRAVQGTQNAWQSAKQGYAAGRAGIANPQPPATPGAGSTTLGAQSNPGANAFGNMATTLGGKAPPPAPAPSSTGGTINPTPAGVSHTSATNAQKAPDNVLQNIVASNTISGGIDPAAAKAELARRASSVAPSVPESIENDDYVLELIRRK